MALVTSSTPSHNQTAPSLSLSLSKDVGRLQSTQSPLIIPTPTHIDQYRIIRLLGKGTFSQVYLCLDTTGNKVAVKVSPLDGDGASLLQREYQLFQIIAPSSNLMLEPVTRDQELYVQGSKCVIKYFDSFTTPTLQCCVMEYFNGTELYDVILEKYRPVEGGIMGIGELTVKYIIRDLLTCLHYLQKKGIAHCDLKLENILVATDTLDNEGALLKDADSALAKIPHIKVIDFGLAQVVTGETLIRKGSEV
jgi:serine/threonine protein kinase